MQPLVYNIIEIVGAVTGLLAVYLNSGWYTVVVTDANNCQISDSVFVDVTADLLENQVNTFLIYPNPAKENIQIVGEGNSLELEIFMEN
jgi:hypothetical protein